MGTGCKPAPATLLMGYSRERGHSKVKHTEAKDLYTNWPSLPTEQKRQIIELITEKIVLHNDSINIVMSFRPAPHHPFSKAGKSTQHVDRSYN